MQLTEEQRNIVTHYQGAAIVYAVAGAGKSTTMAYRVQHLVNTHGVDPQRILVCSFSKATVNDIQQKIANLDVPRVSCYTFNALGRKIVQKAVQDGFFTAFNEEHIEHRNSQLAMRALVELGKQYGKNFSQLDINQEDLQTYISVCKGNLCYANILAAKLPAHTLAYAQQAEHKNAHYLKAYQLYEQIRQQNNWLTFDDQLVLAWEALERFDSIRAWAKSSFDFVLIDEFQDVNKVQVQIADILTEDHRNYMAIGDDDQCIYEWRGADVRYILDFKKRYQAQAYIISDNFRCPAEATLLAGKVIAQNQERQPKDLVSQKGFGGHVVLQGFKSEEDSAQYVVNSYKNLLAQGTHPKDCIVLVRTYSQTSVIEAKLIQEELAYQVIGNQRFYERAEVKVLFTYLSFARQERDYQQSGNQALSEQYIRRFAEVLRHPNRYLSQQWINDFMMQARQQNGSLVNFLAQQLSQVPHQTTQNRLAKLVSILQQLQAKLDDDAGLTLLWLVSELDYLDALKKAAAIPELGEERCQNVRALINYAQKKGTVLAFLEHLRRLHLVDSQSNDTQPKLHIMSIHRAKGLEWPVVFVPCCSKEQMPSVYNDNIEEERRLLYVALTRTKQQLHILYAPQVAMSVFLKKVNAPDILNTANQLATIFNPQTLSHVAPEDIALLAQSLANYPLVRYIQQWWRADSITKALLQQKISDALEQQLQAQQQVAQAQANSLNDIHQSKTNEQQLKSMARRLLLFAKRPVSVLLQHNLTSLPRHQPLSFVAQSHAIEVYAASGQCIGVVDVKHSKFPISEVLDWSWLEGILTQQQKSWHGGQKINLRLKLRHDIQHKTSSVLSAQLPICEKIQYMASPLFKQDAAYLISVLGQK